jgi:hypothetical protein
VSVTKAEKDEIRTYMVGVINTMISIEKDKHKDKIRAIGQEVVDDYVRENVIGEEIHDLDRLTIHIAVLEKELKSVRTRLDEKLGSGRYNTFYRSAEVFEFIRNLPVISHRANMKMEKDPDFKEVIRLESLKASIPSSIFLATTGKQVASLVASFNRILGTNHTELENEATLISMSPEE